MEDDSLISYLESLRRDDCYVVEQVLKEAPHETTELVSFVGTNDTKLGPFVRKRIKIASDMGNVYESVWHSQQQGRRFRYLPRIYDCYIRDDERIVIMEFVTGETLQEVVYQRDPSPYLAAELFPSLCDAVIELHEGFDPPIIHRDLKPSNIILSPQALTIVDFGISRVYRAGATNDTTFFGTRAYAPPEQFGFGQTDTRSDVYALGMLLYYLLREQTPDPNLAGSPFAFDEIPAPLRPVLTRATALRPDDRFQTVRALKQAFLAANSAITPIAQNVRAVASCEANVAPYSAKPPAAASAPAAPVPFAGTIAAGTPSPQIPQYMPAPSQTAAPQNALIKASEVVGLIWDCMLLLFWLLMLLASVVAVVAPPESVQSYPAWTVALIFFGTVMCGMTGTFYLVSDKRWLSRISKLFCPSRKKLYLRIAIGLLIASVVFLIICAPTIATIPH